MIALLLGGCGGDTCRTDVADGAVEALVDGAPYSATAVWSAAGTAIQISTTPDAGWWFNLVLQENVEALAVADAVEQASYPVEIALGTGGFVTAYAEDGGSLRVDAGTVTLIEPPQDGTVAGCFAFAGGDGDLAVDFTDGQVAALAFVP